MQILSLATKTFSNSKIITKKRLAYIPCHLSWFSRRQEENWRQLLDRTVEVESKAVPGRYWAWGEGGEKSQARLEIDSHVFKECHHKKDAN